MHFKFALIALAVLAVSFAAAQEYVAAEPAMDPTASSGTPLQPTFTEPSVIIISSEPGAPVDPSILEPNNNPSAGRDDEEEEDDDDEGGRRRPLALPVEELSTPVDEAGTSENTENTSALSSITGAVIGLIGKKGAIGAGIFILIVGVGAVVVYNRRSLGIVKKAAK